MAAMIRAGSKIDRIPVALIDPAKFRLEVRKAAAGDRNLNAAMAPLGAALVILTAMVDRWRVEAFA
jgi:hypothetical protein